MKGGDGGAEKQRPQQLAVVLQTLLWPGRRLLCSETRHFSAINLRHRWWMTGLGNLPNLSVATTYVGPDLSHVWPGGGL